MVMASAVLHLHDRDWVVHARRETETFRRVEVIGEKHDSARIMQEILLGLLPASRVVSNALVLQNTVEQ